MPKNRRHESKGSLIRESSRGRVGISENRQNSTRFTKQSNDYSQARLIYRANSDLHRRVQTQNSPKTLVKTQSSTSLAGNNRNVSRLTRLDSHIQQREVNKDNFRHHTGRESSILNTSKSSIVPLQRDISRGGLFQSHSSHSLARGNSSKQLQRQSSSSQMPTLPLTRAKSRGQIVTELCTRSVSHQKSNIFIS